MTKVDGERVDSALSLVGHIREKSAGDQVTLTVLRDGKSHRGQGHPGGEAEQQHQRLTHPGVAQEAPETRRVRVLRRLRHALRRSLAP